MKGHDTECEPQPLQEARLLVERAATTGCGAHEFADVRRRLQSVVAHPSCDTALGDRVAAAILVLDLLTLAASPVPDTLAS